TTTTGPSAARRRATASPVTPSPTTRITRRPGRRRHRSGGRRASVERPGDPDEVGVEQAEAEGHEQPGDEPEPHDDGELGPAGQLEVVVDRRHAEHPALEAPE